MSELRGTAPDVPSTAPGRDEPADEGALELSCEQVYWAGFLRGGFSIASLVREGHRCSVALLRTKHVPLTPVEHQALDLLTRGKSRKEAAHELGLSFGTLGAVARTALSKRGLARVEHAVLVAAVLDFGISEPTSIRSLFLDTDALGSLTRAEREVAFLIVDGLGNAEIGARRGGCSGRTVANQVAAIFDKLGVGSRLELVRRLARPLPSAAFRHETPFRTDADVAQEIGRLLERMTPSKSPFHQATF